MSGSLRHIQPQQAASLVSLTRKRSLVQSQYRPPDLPGRTPDYLSFVAIAWGTIGQVNATERSPRCCGGTAIGVMSRCRQYRGRCAETPRTPRGRSQRENYATVAFAPTTWDSRAGGLVVKATPIGDDERTPTYRQPSAR